MRSKLLTQAGEKTFAVIFDTGDEVISGLTEFARQQNLAASHFTAIGGFRDVTLGYFEIDKKEV
jgi:predicted DNA-binding protein with PD1-like motif